MATELYVQKQGWHLVPVNRIDAEALDKIKTGATVKCVLTQPRSVPQHRYYWRILSVVKENTEAFPTTESLHFYLKIKCGYVDHIRVNMNETVLVPQSTSFSAMDQTTFKEYFDAAMHVIETDILPGVTVDALMGEQAA